MELSRTTKGRRWRGRMVSKEFEEGTWMSSKKGEQVCGSGQEEERDAMLPFFKGNTCS